MVCVVMTEVMGCVWRVFGYMGGGKGYFGKILAVIAHDVGKISHFEGGGLHEAGD